MSSAVSTSLGMSAVMSGASVFVRPGSAVGTRPLASGTSYGVLRLPSDPIGIFTLTLTNLVIGSAIRIEVASTGALVELRNADTTTEVFSVPAYAVGNANNDLRIKVRKGSAAPFYKPYETQATAAIGSQSVFIAQIPD